MLAKKKKKTKQCDIPVTYNIIQLLRTFRLKFVIYFKLMMTVDVSFETKVIANIVLTPLLK